MTDGRASLKSVSTASLEHLREAISSGHLKTPVNQASLLAAGIRHQVAIIEQVLAGHRSAACLGILDAILVERADPKPTPELVWTGPEEPGGAARDTAVVLRSLFEGARESVILAGYHFDHAASVLAPLHSSMLQYGVRAKFFVDVPQIAPRFGPPDDHLQRQLSRFTTANWPFGPPLPELYYDKRSLQPGPPFCSLHAKCVVIDGVKAFISSANFTQRGQERNIEVGVLIEDAAFAGYLAGQWLRLIDGGIVAKYAG